MKDLEQLLLESREFERFLLDLSTTFIGLPEERVDADMEDGLARVGEFLQMDRVTLLELSADGEEMNVVYSWCSPGVPRPAATIRKETQAWWMNRVLRGEVSLASRVD